MAQYRRSGSLWSAEICFRRSRSWTLDIYGHRWEAFWITTYVLGIGGWGRWCFSFSFFFSCLFFYLDGTEIAYSAKLWSRNMSHRGRERLHLTQNGALEWKAWVNGCDQDTTIFWARVEWTGVSGCQHGQCCSLYFSFRCRLRGSMKKEGDKKQKRGNAREGIGTSGAQTSDGRTARLHKSIFSAKHRDWFWLVSGFLGVSASFLFSFSPLFWPLDS